MVFFFAVGWPYDGVGRDAIKKHRSPRTFVAVDVGNES